MVTKDDESQAWVVITVASITMGIAFTALACRVFTRAVLVKHFGVDDWAAVVAGIMLLMCGLMVTIDVKNGLGRHSWTITDTERVPYYKYFYASIIFYNATLVSVKIAFLLQYYRVFAVAKIRRIILFFMVLITGWSLSQLFVSIFTCTPIHKFWDESVTTGRCINATPQWYINAAGNITTDIIIFLLPMPVLKNIHLKRTQKLIVMGIFSLGFFTVAISVIRIKYLRQNSDFSWDNVASACWSVGELSSAVTCLCLPTLRPLLVRLRPHVFGNSSGNSSNRSKRSSFRGFFKQSEASGSHLRTHSDGNHSANGGSRLSHYNQKEGQNGASPHNKNISQDMTVGDGAFPSSISQDDLYSAALDMSDGHGRGRGRGLERQSPFDIEAARRGYFLPPLPDWSQDSLRFPENVLCRDAIGMQGTVTTTIGSERPVTPGEELLEPPTGQIAVRHEVQRESSPWRV
ncbi:integral membrane protein [Ophiostoma piceae UAMH 11346]|uniref:Integral membrane protein n=1 Tax=Ophiostoma piceae (strain UAMH 11346) TaxID=1262450 RepID=S3C9H8_OPHP1|nr:integral membrane protein [Ophiostoma piceae UAMH 11346]